MSIEESVFDFLADLGRSIDEIKFNKIPSDKVFEALIEKNSNIRFDMLNAEAVYLVEGIYSANVIAARFKTDIFIDSVTLYEYSKLENLIIECTNSADYIDVQDLSDMQLAIVNLTNLKKLELDVRKMKPDAVKQIENYIKFPCSDFEFFIKKKKRI